MGPPREVTGAMYVADPRRDTAGVRVLHFCGHQHGCVGDTVAYSRPVGLFSRFTLPSVKPSEAMDMLSAGATMLDVRDNSEWNAGRVPGAVHVPAANVAAQAPKRLPKGRPVVIACRTGSRSKAATRLLREQGIEAYSLSGGLAAWESAGGRVAGKGNKPGMIA
ncbi:MAG: rhodanese-like domain-containing protein [Acidimicrobiales bacterium]|nr:MAG: rhodanese-like domain-containing protein [Acidimicrobiales bacterium]